jgi:hypothetical protein
MHLSLRLHDDILRKDTAIGYIIDLHIFLVHLLTMKEVLSHRLFRKIACFLWRFIGNVPDFLVVGYKEYAIPARVTSMRHYVVTRPVRSNSDEDRQ